MERKVVAILLIFVLALGLVACASNEEATVDNEEASNAEVVEENESTDDSIEAEEEVATEPYLVFTDGMGREITLEEEPMTVISVAPSVTETVYAVGAGDKLVGRTDYCNYPEAALDVDSIGSLREVNIERISEINPDIVLASTHFKEETLNKIESLGIPVAMIINQENFDGVYSNIETVGLILNKEKEAKAVVSEMKTTVDTVKEKLDGVEKKSVYYVIGYGEYGDYTATGDTFIHGMIELAGGDNIAKDATGWKYTLEKIVEHDPEMIFAENNEATLEGIRSANGYKDLTAVQEGQLYGINKQKIEIMGPRLAEGLLELAKMIHPARFN